MRFSARRKLLLTTSAGALGAALSMAAPSAAWADCTITGVTVECTGTSSGTVTVPNGYNLLNSGTIVGDEGTTITGVIGEGSNVLTNSGNITAVADAITIAESGQPAFSASPTTSAIGVSLVSNSILNTSGTIVAAINIGASYSGVTTEGSNTYNFSGSAIGVYDFGDTTISNTGSITAAASHSLALNSLSSVSVSGVIDATAIFGLAYDPIYNDKALTGVATSTFTFDEVSGISETSFFTSANGVVALENLVLVNTGTITATATTTIDLADVSNVSILGGDFDRFAVTTSFAAGVQAFYNANIYNTGTISASATLQGTWSNVTNADFGGGEFEVPPGAAAIGIYVGPSIRGTGSDYAFGEPSISIDSVTNAGTVTATSVVDFAVTNPNGDFYFDTFATAAGIAVVYPSGDSYASYSGFVQGQASILNSGTINATANASYTFTATQGEPYSGFGLQASAVGIAVGGAEGLRLDQTLLGVGSVFNPMATISVTNTGTIKATANASVAIALTDAYAPNLSGWMNSSAVGIAANGLFIGGGESSPDVLISATIVNTGKITAAASTAVQFQLDDAYLYSTGDYYSYAGGILGWPTSSVTNSGTIDVSAQVILSGTTKNDSYAYFGTYISVHAAGIDLSELDYPCCNIEGAGSIISSGTIKVSALSSASFDIAAGEAADINLQGYAYAVGIGGAEGLPATLQNSGTLSVLAASTVTVAGSLPGTYDLYSAARGLYAIDGGTLVNSGSIAVAALASFTATSRGVSFSHSLGVEAVAFGMIVEEGSESTINNTGSISGTATVSYTLKDFVGEVGGGELFAYGAGIVLESNGTAANAGTIAVLAQGTIDAPNVTFLSGSARIAAYGIFSGVSVDAVINNTGSIGAVAALTINSLGAGGEPGDEPFFAHEPSRNVNASGIRSGGVATIVNSGTIIVESSVKVNGTVVSGLYDPSGSYGIFAGDGSTVTNHGLVATTRVGPHHWSVFLEDSIPGTSYFYNHGTSIGSVYVGTYNYTYNYGTMNFRLLAPADQGAVAGYGTYDRIVVKPGATFDTAAGTIMVVPQAGAGLFGPTTTYRYFIDNSTNADVTNVVGLTAGANVNLKSASAFLVPTLVAPTDPASSPASHTGYDLVLTRIPFTGPAGTELEGNQNDVAKGLETAFTGALNDPSGDFAKFLGKIQALPPGTPAGTFQQLAGEITANLGNIGYSNAGQLMGLLFGRLGSLQGGFLSASSSTLQVAQPMVQLASSSSSVDFAQAPPGAPNSRSMFANSDTVFWMSGYGQTASIDSQPGITGVRSNVAGAMVGIEKRYSERFKLGVTVGGGAAWSKLKDDIDSTAKGKFFQGALYGSYAMGAWYVDGAAGYAYHRVNTQRTITFPGFSDRLEGDVSAHQFIGGLETGYNLDIGGFRFTPFVGLQATVFRQDGYSETGGAAALRYGAETTTSVRGLVGAQFRTTFAMSETMRLDPYLRAAWAHEFADRNSTVSASFLGSPSSSFALQGAERSRDAALIGGGFELTTGPMFSLFAAYSGEIAKANSSHAGTVGFRMRW